MDCLLLLCCIIIHKVKIRDSTFITSDSHVPVHLNADVVLDDVKDMRLS